jgi:predicted nucleic acid-binding protein
LIADGERILLAAPVLYEWRRGPRLLEEIADQEALFASGDAVPFGSEEALLAAKVYGAIRRPRGREIDIAIAACAIVHDARLWTLNHDDFADIPGITLLDAA